MSTATERGFRVALFAVLLAVSVLYTVEALTFNVLTMYAPLVAGTLASVLLTIALVRELARIRAAGRGEARVHSGGIESTDDVLTAATLRTSAKYLGILLAFVAAVYVFGLILSACVFVALLLRFDAKAGVLFIGVSLAAIPVSFWLLSRFVGLQWPEGIVW